MSSLNGSIFKFGHKPTTPPPVLLKGSMFRKETRNGVLREAMATNDVLYDGTFYMGTYAYDYGNTGLGRRFNDARLPEHVLWQEAQGFYCVGEAPETLPVVLPEMTEALIVVDGLMHELRLQEGTKATLQAGAVYAGDWLSKDSGEHVRAMVMAEEIRWDLLHGQPTKETQLEWLEKLRGTKRAQKQKAPLQHEESEPLYQELGGGACAQMQAAMPASLPAQLPTGTRLRTSSGATFVALKPALLTPRGTYRSNWKRESNGEVVEDTVADPEQVLWDELPAPRCGFCGDRFASRPEFDGAPENGNHTMCQGVVDARQAIKDAAAKIANCESCGAPFRKGEQGGDYKCTYCQTR